jgi:hypothetical protein
MASMLLVASDLPDYDLKVVHNRTYRSFWLFNSSDATRRARDLGSITAVRILKNGLVGRSVATQVTQFASSEDAYSRVERSLENQIIKPGSTVLSVEPVDQIDIPGFDGFIVQELLGTSFVFTNDDPLNATDPLCNISCGFCKKILNASETVNRMIVDVPQDASYLVYWGSYEAIRGTAKLENDCGSLKAACKTVGRIISAPLVVPEAAGLAGNGLAELAKGETIWQDDTPKQPLFGNQPGGKQLSDAFDDLFGTQIGRNMIFPGFNSRNRSIDFAWP